MGTLLQDSLRCRLCCEETAAGQDAFTARLEVPEGAGDLLLATAAEQFLRLRLSRASLYPRLVGEGRICTE
jgi:hypothetical protein